MNHRQACMDRFKGISREKRSGRIDKRTVRMLQDIEEDEATEESKMVDAIKDSIPEVKDDERMDEGNDDHDSDADDEADRNEEKERKAQRWINGTQGVINQIAQEELRGPRSEEVDEQRPRGK